MKLFLPSIVISPSIVLMFYFIYGFIIGKKMVLAGERGTFLLFKMLMSREKATIFIAPALLMLAIGMSQGPQLFHFEEGEDLLIGLSYGYFFSRGLELFREEYILFNGDYFKLIESLRSRGFIQG